MTNNSFVAEVTFKSYGISGQVFGLISHFLSNSEGFHWFWMESLHKNIQLMLEFLKGPFLVLHFSCYILMTFLMMLICNIAIYGENTILYSKCDQASDMINLNWLLNFNLVFKTLWTPVRSFLLISMVRKLSWFRLTSLIMVLLM